MNQSGYFRFPTISGDNVIFVCEDELWSVSSKGGYATRLTSNLAEITRPFLSPDGKTVAFVGREEGNPEVYCMSSDGGIEKRLTFMGGMTNVIGWSKDGKYILFTSNANQPFARMFKIYRVSPEGGMPELMPYGLAHNVSYSSKKGTVLGIHTTDPARWKRYRGGTAGVIWVDTKDNGEFKKLIDLNGNLGSPMWVEDRIYFISDHEGMGNIYSCKSSGKDLKQHTNNKDYFVRNASTDGKKIVYHAGGDLFIFDPEKNKQSKIKVDFHSPKVQRNRKFVNTLKYMDSINLHPEGHSLVLTSRGKPFTFSNWEGAVTQLGESDGVRYRLTQWLSDDKFVTISDQSGKERLEIHQTGYDSKVQKFEKLDIGRPLEMEASPTDENVAISNHRQELIFVDLKKKKLKVLDKSKYHRLQGICWSPDGKWIAYSCADTQNTFSIKICNIETEKTYRLTDTRFKDVNPSFDPEGKFIYFLSYREFNPVYDSMYFDLGFPRGLKLMLVSLKKDTLSPFVDLPESMKEKDEKKDDKKDSKDSKKKNKKDDDEKVKVEIDFDGIENRVSSFPLPEAKYRHVWGAKGKVVFSYAPIKGSLDMNWDSAEEEAGVKLEYFDFETKKNELIATNISYFKVSSKSENLLYKTGSKIRITSILPSDKNKPSEDKASKKSGWIDLNRVKVSVNPPEEWKQMYTEIWRLQEDHFWDPDMCGIDWKKVYKRYLPLLDRITTRSEFSDLIWEMQGELGTSHAYEIGGDYRKGPNYVQGYLGADFEFDEKSNAYKVSHIVNGDHWKEKEDSSLNRLGVNVKEGDILLAVNGQKLDKNTPPNYHLVHQANSEVVLTFANKSKKKNASKTRDVLVKVLSNDTRARYREWVENNRKKVHEATKGKVGYIHIPNMGPEGYSEFHRYYFAEVEKGSLVIDVRYNGGGHVSQLLLEKLVRKRIAYNINRWGSPEPYPDDSVLGSIIAVTNEYAGSDGDIFSHCYKIMNLGKLIGKRTWGGVIGIWPRHRLVDGSITTQPEFSFWFVDVGWGVENYGTAPDIEIDYKPQDWANGIDPQLDKSIELILKDIKKNPPKLPDFGKKPHLPIPE